LLDDFDAEVDAVHLLQLRQGERFVINEKFEDQEVVDHPLEVKPHTWMGTQGRVIQVEVLPQK
jgi:hypothetical protein